MFSLTPHPSILLHLVSIETVSSNEAAKMKTTVQKKKLKGNATGLNMTGIARNLRNNGMVCSQAKVSPMTYKAAAKSTVMRWCGDEGIQDGVGTADSGSPACSVLAPGVYVGAMPPSSLSTSSGIELIDDDDLMPISFKSWMAKARLKKRICMKDQFENIPLQVVPRTSKCSSKRQKTKPHLLSLSRQHVSESIHVTCRMIRLGTHCWDVVKPVTFTTEFIQLDESVCVATSKLTKCYWCHSRKMPSLFLRTTPAECRRLCDLLQMQRPNPDRAPRYDRNSSVLSESYIILIFVNQLTDLHRAIMKEIFATIGSTNHVDDFQGEFTFEEANSLIMQSSRMPVSGPDIFAGEISDVLSSTEVASPVFKSTQYRTISDLFICTTPSLGTSGLGSLKTHKSISSYQLLRTWPADHPSQTHITVSDDRAVDLNPSFTEPARRFIVYPPPPARHGIAVTEEDLHCLNAGEFLNDVIIDFYLMYLVTSKLTEEDAKRSHVFSSFFYQRLLQRSKGNVSDPEHQQVKKQRHSRVKTWTRHVDLFQKDFIFVPINQSSHWFLAVICFPGEQVSQSQQESPERSPQSPPVSSPQHLSPDVVSALVHHNPQPSPDHLLQPTDTNHYLSSLFAPQPQEQKDDMGCTIQQELLFSNPMSPQSLGIIEDNLFFPDMDSCEGTAVSSSDLVDDLWSSIMEPCVISRTPTVEQTEHQQFCAELSSSDEAEDLWLSFMESHVTSNTDMGGQADHQTPHADDCNKISEDPAYADMLSFDKDAEHDESRRKEWQNEKRGVACISSTSFVCKRNRPCILIMDSLGGHERADIVETLQEYLEVEWELRKGTRRMFRHMEGCSPQVPQQDNFSDCGIYLLQYVESFFQVPLQNYQPPIDLRAWFPIKEVKRKRAEIRELILSLEQQQELNKL